MEKRLSQKLIFMHVLLLFGVVVLITDSTHAFTKGKIYHTIHCRLEGSQGTGYVRWIGKKGMEREILSQEYYLYHQNREGGPVENPNKYSYLMMNSVPEPFDLRGTVLKSCVFAGSRTDSSFQ